MTATTASTICRQIRPEKPVCNLEELSRLGSLAKARAGLSAARSVASIIFACPPLGG